MPKPAASGRPKRRRKLAASLSVALPIIVLVLLLVVGTSGAASTPTISTDQADYAPGATVTLTGANWQPGEAVHIDVNDNVGQTWSYSVDVTADSSGGFTNQFQLPTSFVASYLVTATGPVSGTVTTTFTDSAISSEQCQNGAVGPPAVLAPCQGSNLAGVTVPGFTGTQKNWQSGNSNSAKSHWREGEFIPERVDVSGVAAGQHTLLFSYATVSGGKHALDYLGSFDATETTGTSPTSFHANNNNPCADYVAHGDLLPSDCLPASPKGQTAVPAANLSSFGSCPTTPPPGTVPQVAGAFKIFGPSGTSFAGSPTYTSQNVQSGTTCATTVSLTFNTPDLTHGGVVIIAFGAHIASQADWGANNSATYITGSPWHVDMVSFDGGSAGTQSLQLATGAVVFTPSMTTAIKTADGTTVTSVTVGTTVHDTATLTGAAPTAAGTVTYERFTNGTCSGTTHTDETKSVTNGIVQDSSPFIPTTAGAYSYLAVYSGDSSTNTEATTSACEPLNVSQAAPTITTAATGSVVVGGSASDTATLSGLVSPTGSGTVTFTAYSDSACTTKLFGPDTVAFDSNGSKASDPYTTAFAGTLYWVASYSGDSNNFPASTTCGDKGETTTVTKAQPSISTLAVGSVTVGGSASDTATLSGLVKPDGTGTVTFTAYSDSFCSTKVFGPDVHTFDSNGNVTSANYPTTSAGTLYWVATYSGDANNAQISTACGDLLEITTVTKAQPAISTYATQSVPVGGTASDTATLSGVVYPDGTGTVTFTAYADSLCSTKVFGPDTVAFDANGKVTSDPYTTAAAGTLYWVAGYSGDGNNSAASTHCGDKNESTTVNKAQPGITTLATPSVTVGGSASDTATLSGLVNPDGTGTVTFSAYSDSSCSTKVFGPDVHTFDSNTGSVTSNSYTTVSAGAVYWVASYGGDANNSAASTKCGDPGEVTTVAKAQPGIATSATPSVTVGQGASDTATLSGLVKPDGTGTVTFTAYSDSSCSTKVFGPDVHTFDSNTGGVSSASYKPTATGTIYWIATYAGDSNNASASTKCGDPGEVTTVTKAQPAIVTSATASVTVGGGASDTATLSGLMYPTGTGKVTFTAYSDSACSTQVFTSTVPASGGITANGSVTSASYTPTSPGTIYWVASYGGDGNNLRASTNCGDPGETTTVTKAQPAILTYATQSVTVGGAASDTATLSSLVYPDGTGKVTFTAYSDSSCSTKVFGPDTVAFDANGNVTSDPYTTAAAGTLYWVASYGGDANNLSASTHCGDKNETTTVNKAQPAIATTVVDATGVTVDNTHPAASTGPVNDTATLTGQVSTISLNSGATVTYSFYKNGTCSGTPASTQTVTVNAGGTVPPSSAQTLAPGSYSYNATYSGNSNYLSATGQCEPFKVIQKSLITDSTLCTFDLDTSSTAPPGSTFRLLFTPDQSPSVYKLNASNPGQFYYNVFDGTTSGITFTLPYPFVTQGAVAIHVYDSVSIQTVNGQTCLVPGNEIANSGAQVALSNYSPQGFGSTQTATITFNPAIKFAYANIHVDYGLKTTTGYAKGGITRSCNSSPNDAVSQTNTSQILVPDCQSYTFSETDGGSNSQVASSENVFKRDPGVAGLVQKTGTLAPVPNVAVVISGDGQTQTVTTDNDGWYMWVYKYTGKATTFTVTLPAYNMTQSVTVKSNGFVVASPFLLP